MSNEYFNFTSRLSRHTLGRAENVNAIIDAIQSGFGKLPAENDLIRGKVTFAVDTGDENSLVVAMPKTMTAYSDGASIAVRVGTTNTGATTINVDGLGARPIKLPSGVDPAPGDLTSGDIIVLLYDLTNTFWVLATPARSSIDALGAKNYRGDYKPWEEYNTGDSVTLAGDLYQAKLDELIDVTPAEGLSWRLIGSNVISATSSGAAQTVRFRGLSVHNATADAETVTFTFDAATGTSRLDLVIDYQIVTPYVIITGYYEKQYALAGISTAHAVQFKADGTKMYVLSNADKDVTQYTLSTAWDVGTATNDSVTFSVNSEETAPTGMAFKSDGTKMYVVGTTSDTVFQYTLSTAWDLSTASYDSVSFSVSSQDANPTGLTFKEDGTIMYMVGTTNDTVYQYTLSTAWDLSTASYASKSFDVGSQMTVPNGVAFSSDGEKMFVSDANEVYEYDLSTGWDVSTAAYNSVRLNAGDAGAPTATNLQDLTFGNNGNQLYLLNQSAATVSQFLSVSGSALVFPSEVEMPTISLYPNEKTALSIVTADSGASYQVVSTQGGID